MQRPAGPRFTTLLAAAATGVYILVVLGATAALADAATACGGWPICSGPITTGLVVAVGHRVAATAVALLVVAAALWGWTGSTTGRVRAALATALGLYPLQVAVGAIVALGGATAPLPAIHLVLGIAIFGALVLALAWQLEAETADAPSPETDPGTNRRSTDEAGPVATAPSTSRQRLLATGRAYLRLTKPRLMWLLCLVASAGMALAAGPNLAPSTVVATLGGGVLAIGASGTFNHVLERDVDRRMARTADRPLATDRVPVRNALIFGAVLAVASVAVFLQVNLLAAALGLSAILFYSVIYTVVLKPNTVQNTVLGGAAGALPAMIGWVAVTGRFGWPGLALAGVVFLWTPAHFYNLALAYREDYERGGFPMLSVVRGEAVTRKHVLYYLGATLVGAVALAAVADLGWLYASTTVGLGAVFLWAVVRLHRERTDRAALRSFHASNAYLGLLLVAIVLDAIVV